MEHLAKTSAASPRLADRLAYVGPLDLLSRWVIMLGVALIASQRGMVAAVGAVLIVAALGLRPSFQRLDFPVTLAVLLAWCGLSLSWTIAIPTTVNELIRTVVIAVAAWSLARTTHSRQAGRLLAGGFTLVSLTSLIAVLVAPATAYDDEGLLRGVISHPNGLALIAAAGLVCGLLSGNRQNRLVQIVSAAVNVAALVLSGSVTSTLGACVAVGLALLFAVVRTAPDRSQAVQLLTLGAGSLLAVTVVAQNLTNTLESVGRDATLTGRTKLWSGIWNLIQEHPVLGWGLGGPWAPTPTHGPT